MSTQKPTSTSKKPTTNPTDTTTQDPKSKDQQNNQQGFSLEEDDEFEDFPVEGESARGRG